jgi:Pyruvate/2-oxoacid:ferredoxin oxidoreductase delta subunit
VRRKKPEKSTEQIKREDEQFFKKNREEVEAFLLKCCNDYGLNDFEPPFSNEEAIEILSIAREHEVEEIEKLFPGFGRYGEDLQVNCKLCFKFHLDPKIVTDRQKILKAISYKLNKGSSDSSANPELCKFKK